MSDETSLFGRSNLAAWCIVPYDGARRGPVERAAMLAELGLRHFVWDWRPEHLPSFEAELDELGVEGIYLDGVWFPVRLGESEPDDAGRFLVAELERRAVSTDLWVCTEFGPPGPVPELAPSEREERVAAHAAAIVPAARAARELGGRVGLYNHLGWFGEPENQLAVADRLADLGFDNVGLVYNQHHGHAHVARFESLLESIAPRLIALNLNGMAPEGDLRGRKLLPVGHGELDGELLASAARVLGGGAWQGRVGVIGHTADDARDRLLDNLEGLDWLVARWQGGASRDEASQDGASHDGASRDEASHDGASRGEQPDAEPPTARIPSPVLPDW